MNYGAMLVAGRGASETGTRASDLKEARSVYERAVRLGRRMQSPPPVPLQKARPPSNAPEVAEHMVSQAEAALRTIEARLAREASATTDRLAAEPAAQRSCTVM